MTDLTKKVSLTHQHSNLSWNIQISLNSNVVLIDQKSSLILNISNLTLLRSILW